MKAATGKHDVIERNIGLLIALCVAVVSVGGLPVSAGEYQRAYNRQRQFYAQLYQGRLDENMIQQLGLDSQVLETLVTERLVERHVSMPEAPDPFLAAQCLRDRLSDRDADVLDGVVGVDVQVALRGHVEVDHAVPRSLVEHVVEERHAGGELRLAGPVEVQRHRDVGLGGLAGHGCGSHGSTGSRSGRRGAARSRPECRR